MPVVLMMGSWWYPPAVVPGQITAPAVLPTTAPAVMSNEQYLAQYLAQQSSAADGSWGVPNTFTTLPTYLVT